MKLYFIGADHEVTGSCHVLEINGRYVLLDYGMEQGRDLYVNQPLPVKPAQIDAVLLSHAHMDHSGLIPLLVKEGFTGAIYATGATCDLCSILLKDSAHIQESEAEWKTRKAIRAGKDPVEPLYTVADAEAAIQYFVPVPYHKNFDVIPGVSARFEDVGHLLGSASIHLRLEEEGVQKSLIFSGDIGNRNQPIIEDPTPAENADYIIMESTYGDRNHETPENFDYIPPLVDLLKESVCQGGTLLIPCFAVGRTQQMLYFLREIINRKLLELPADLHVYVDSPLAAEATKIFENNTFGYYDEDAMTLVRSGEMPLRFPGLELTISMEESKSINFDEHPKVILSASGMCDAGRVRHHLKHNLWKKNCTVVFVGYQAEGTLGRKLLEGADEVTLFGEKIEVRANIRRLEGISGHADQNGLIAWVDALTDTPSRVFVVHGEDTVCDVFADLIQTKLGFPADAPYSGAIFDLTANSWETKGERIPIVRTGTTPETAKKDRIFDRLLAAGQKLLSIIRRSSGRPNQDMMKFTRQVEDLCEKWDLPEEDPEADRREKKK